MNITAILAVVCFVLFVGLAAAGWELKQSWQANAVEKQAVAQAATTIKQMSKARQEREGVENSCSKLDIGALIDRLHNGAACD